MMTENETIFTDYIQYWINARMWIYTDKQYGKNGFKSLIVRIEIIKAKWIWFSDKYVEYTRTEVPFKKKKKALLALEKDIEAQKVYLTKEMNDGRIKAVSILWWQSRV